MKNIIKFLELAKNETEDIGVLNDFYIEPESGGQYRLIHEDIIDGVFFEEIIELIKDCYDLNLPSFIEIDWEATVNNCRMDGFGHHFSSYDGSEKHLDGYYIFRTN